MIIVLSFYELTDSDCLILNTFVDKVDDKVFKGYLFKLTHGVHKRTKKEGRPNNFDPFMIEYLFGQIDFDDLDEIQSKFILKLVSFLYEPKNRELLDEAKKTRILAAEYGWR